MIMEQLDILLFSGYLLYDTILERFESKKYYGFNLFASNERYAAALTQIIGILITSSSQDMTCVISLSGLEKLDNQINTIKAKTFTCLNKIFKYVFNEVSNS